MKERITITIDAELLEWLDSNIKKKVFANRSHGFEFLIQNKKDLDEKRDKATQEIKSAKQ